MIRNQVQGNLRQITGKMRETWGTLIRDENQQIAGKREFVFGQFQKKYGISKEDDRQRSVQGR